MVIILYQYTLEPPVCLGDLAVNTLLQKDTRYPGLVCMASLPNCISQHN